jgi:hypothetical protein
VQIFYTDHGIASGDDFIFHKLADSSLGAMKALFYVGALESF